MEIVISKERKKIMQLITTPMFSAFGCFHLSQSKISKNLTKIATSVNLSMD